MSRRSLGEDGLWEVENRFGCLFWQRGSSGGDTFEHFFL